MQSHIIGVRFTKIGKTYHFDSKDVPNVKVGEHVIVDTARGKHLGEIIQRFEETPATPKGGWKKVLRLATPRDLLLAQTWQAKEIEAMVACREKVSETKLRGVKIVKAEFNYDGSRLTYLYSSEEDEKVNVNNLRKIMQDIYEASKVEMRQIGPRDVAKILGGLGACGLETRCCTKFLTDFSPISIKMAKAQGISLAPSEITGMCGRLRCCLIYEYEAYAAARKVMPKRKKRVVTPKGEGRVVDLMPLTETVVVQLDDEVRGARHSFHRDEIEPWDEREALRRKAAEPCGENCSCGKHTSEEEKQDAPA
ncbi:MAG: stage 0 sporulation protein [Anaerolineae bacterium]|jgi:cell fate regulator YaaT (PSP1 superfamily)|nr:stage 0 sporulation protein [Anaerolineae bacterium]MBT7072792.1 stage 0 sporulation protein [Anaerolineae bacterium]MBT7323795.1 stage 0 sporulation protein [Anaerolineae bacterium]